MKNGRKERVWTDDRFLMIFFAIFFTVLGWYLYLNYKRAKISGEYTGCQWNCMKLGEALDKYAADHDDRYPPSLSSLSPDYIKEIPRCSAAGKDIYSGTYQVSSDFFSCSFYCKGDHHTGVGVPADYPRFNSDYGLIPTQFNPELTPLNSLKHSMKTKSLRAITELIARKPEIVSDRNYLGENALFAAIEYSKPDVVKLLISKGADVNAVTGNNETALFYAVSRQEVECAKVLLDAGMKVNEKRYDGTSPLFLAVKNNDRKMVKLLMQYGADVNAAKDGVTPLDLAKKEQYLRVEKILHGE